MVIAARMGELCGGSEGFPCKGQKWLHGYNQNSLMGSRPFKYSVFHLLEFKLPLFCSWSVTQWVQAGQRVTKKKNPVLCVLAQEIFNAHPVKIHLKNVPLLFQLFFFFQSKITFLIVIKLSIQPVTLWEESPVRKQICKHY